jgi:hypothetical protein
MATMDYPNVRASSRCPLCLGVKEKGLLVCWSCYREQGLRYGNPEAEQSIQSAEDSFVRHADSASTKRDAVHNVGNKI